MGALLKSGNEMLREMGILPDLDKKHPMRRSQAKNAATRRPITKAQPAQVPMSGVGSNPNVGNHDELFAGFDENDQLLVQLQSLLQQSELIAPVADTESVELNDLVSLVSSLQGEWVEKKTN